jgi:hypothetical protein
MKKFHQTIMSNLLHEYHGMRTNLGLMCVLYIIQFFKCKDILEMGFWEGKTFGMMLEATQPHSNLTTVDIKFQMDLYNRHYANSSVTKDKKINFINMSSLDFVSDTKFDFILVDVGSKPAYTRIEDELMYVDENDIHTRYLDMIHASTLLTDRGILMVDGYRKYPKAFEDFLKCNHQIVPFLMDNQAMYFHNINHDAGEFLDVFLEQTLPQEFVSTYNIEYHGHTVKHLDPCPIYVESKKDLFKTYCLLEDL